MWQDIDGVLLLAQALHQDDFYLTVGGYMDTNNARHVAGKVYENMNSIGQQGSSGLSGEMKMDASVDRIGSFTVMSRGFTQCPDSQLPTSCLFRSPPENPRTVPASPMHALLSAAIEPRIHCACGYALSHALCTWLMMSMLRMWGAYFLPPTPHL